MKKSYITIILILSILILSLNNFYPNSNSFLYSEDNLVENITAGIFFGTFLYNLHFLKKIRNVKVKRFFISTAIFSLICFLDEVSFFWSTFKFDKPRYIFSIDAFHDTFKILKYAIPKILYEPLNYKTEIIFALILILFFVFLIIKSIDSLPKKFIINLFPYILFLALFATVSQLLDLKIMNFSFSNLQTNYILEELFELHVAITLLFISFESRRADLDMMRKRNYEKNF